MPLNDAYAISAADGQKRLIERLNERSKSGNFPQDFVPLDAMDQNQALQEASAKQLRFVLMPSQVTHLGTSGAGAGAAGFYLVRLEIKYKLIKVSDSRVVAHDSLDSTGMIGGKASVNAIFADLFQQVARRIVHDVAKKS
jgi:hypothetical protein